MLVKVLPSNSFPGSLLFPFPGAGERKGRIETLGMRLFFHFCIFSRYGMRKVSGLQWVLSGSLGSTQDYL